MRNNMPDDYHTCHKQLLQWTGHPTLEQTASPRRWRWYSQHLQESLRQRMG